MITQTLRNALFAASIALAAQPALTQEAPATADFPAPKPAAAAVLAPLTAQVIAELQVSRLTAELTAQPPQVRLAALSEPSKPGIPKK